MTQQYPDVRYRVWWVSNPSRPPFYFEVVDTFEAILVLEVLAKYDLSLGDRIFMNAGGLEALDDGEWVEWADHDGNDLHDLLRDFRDDQDGLITYLEQEEERT
jgi:hypothetical protein